MEGQVDYDRIKRNIAKMIGQNAPESDIDSYVASEGVTPAQLRATRVKQPTVIDSLIAGIPTYARVAGGLAGGALGAPGGPVTAIAGGALAAEGAGQLAEAGLRYFQGEKPKSPMKIAQESAINMTTDVGVQALTFGAGRLLPKLRAGAVKENAGKVMEDLRNAGISERGAAPIVGGRSVQRAAETGQKLYLSADVWDDAIRTTKDDFAKSFERTRGSIGTATEKATGGEAVLTGVDSYAKRSGAIADRLYGRVRGLDQLPVDIQETKAVANELLARTQKGLGDAKTEAMLKDIIARPDSIQFGDAKLLRSDLLSIARQQDSLMAEKAESAGKLLGKILTRNMDNSARQLDPAQYSRWERANAFYKQRAGNLEAVDRIWKSDSGQAAFNAAVQGAPDGPAKLAAIKKVLPAEQWDEFRSVFLHQLGLESKGAATTAGREFNPQSYLSNYAALSPKSKETLFGVATALRNELDRLARIAGYFRDTRVMANPSGTAGSALSTGQIAAAGGGLTLMATGSPISGAMAALLPTAGAYGSAKLMTNPRFVRWLADGARLPPGNPNALKQHLARLATVTTLQPELREDIQEYLDSKRIRTR